MVVCDCGRTKSQCIEHPRSRSLRAMSVVMLALQLSLALLVLSIGLETRPGDALFLFRHPALFARSVVAINLIMPVLVLWVALVFALKPPVELALLAMAMSPMPPFLPLSTAKAGGEGAYTVALLAAESVLALGLIPLATWLLGLILQSELQVPVGVVASIVGMTILLPLALGIAVRWRRPNLADRLAKPVNIATIVLLIVGSVPLLIVTFMPMISLIGNGTILAIVAIAIIGLGVGHALGGPDPKDQPVLALATASRHPAVAIAIASSMFPEAKLAPAAVVLTLLVTAIATIPYQKWAKKSQVPPARLPLILPTAERRSVPRSSPSPGPAKMHAQPPAEH